MNEKHMMHGKEWIGQDLRGWLASEKLHGCRAYWDGQQMWTRGGQLVELPPHLKNLLPAGMALDGEVYAGRGPNAFHLACEAVNHGRWSSACSFQVFDAPEIPGGWQQRMEFARAHVAEGPYLACVSSVVIHTPSEAIRMMDGIQRGGGEGIMLRHPAAPYRTGRHRTLLKMKKVPDYLRPARLKTTPRFPLHALAA